MPNSATWKAQFLNSLISNHLLKMANKNVVDKRPVDINLDT